MADIHPEIIKAYSLTVLSATKVKDVIKLETTDGPKCLKPFDLSEKRLRFVCAAMDHLTRRGFKKIAPFIPACDGRPYLSIDKKLFFLTDWIEGRECYFGDPEDLRRAAATLAQFHRYAKGFILPPDSTTINMLGKWPLKFEAHSNDLLAFKKMAWAKPEKSPFDRHFLEHADACHTQAEEALALITGPGYASLVREAREDLAFIHRDVAGRNFIITPDQEAHMIDFDYARLDMRANDIVRLLERSMKKCRWDFALAEEALDSYNRVCPIKEEEYPVILAFLTFPQKIWRVTTRYYKNKRNWSEKKFNAQLQLFIEQFEWKNSFLRKFREKYCPTF